MVKSKEKKDNEATGYSAVKYSFVQPIIYKNENFLIGLDRKESKVFYWNIKLGEWNLFKFLDD